MSLHRSRPRTFAAWLGAVALLLHVLLPLAPAWSAPGTDSATFPADCVAHAAELPQNGDAPDGDGPFDADRCPLCLMHAVGLGIVTVPPGVPAPVTGPLGYAVPTTADAAALPFGIRPFPRGPPPAI